MLENMFICAIGLALHFGFKWKAAREKAESVGAPIPGLLVHIQTIPAVTMISILSAAGAFYVCNGLDWMNPGMAFACGYAPNSMVKNIGDRFSTVPK